METTIQLPDDLLDVIASMLPGRESIEFWMVRNRISDRSDARVTTELLRRLLYNHDTTTNATHHIHLTTSTEMDIILPLWVESVTFICPWVTSIGNGWMTGHPSLTHVDFADMSSIETVGHDWMCRCASLVSIDFGGLIWCKLLVQYLGRSQELENYIRSAYICYEPSCHSWTRWALRRLHCTSISFLSMSGLTNMAT